MTTTAARRPRRDALENRAGIIAAAQSVLATDPNASLDAIAHAAGLSRRALYGHFSDREALLRAAIGGAALFAFFWLLRAIRPGGMGGGDVKFAAALGLWFGWQQTLLTLFLTFIIAGVSGAALLALKLKSRKDFIPFGPFIAVGALITLFYGPRIIAWYIKHLAP